MAATRVFRVEKDAHRRLTPQKCGPKKQTGPVPEQATLTFDLFSLVIHVRTKGTRNDCPCVLCPPRTVPPPIRSSSLIAG
jgi:hypothetical protein